jgi:hypothetical protein
MELEGSLPCSEEVSTGPRIDAAEFNPHPPIHPIFPTNFNFIFPYILTGRFPSDYPI